MLAAALPHALETPKSERHGFQASVLQQVHELVEKEAEKRQGAIVEAQQKVAAHEKDAEEAAAKLEAASTDEAVKNGHKVAAETIAAEHNERTEAAKQAAQAAHAAIAEAKKVGNKRVEEKADFANKFEAWQQVAEGNFEKKDWRLRDKAIKQVCALLGPDAPESLKVALPLALKEAPAARTPFTNRTVEVGFKELNEQLNRLDASINEAQHAVIAAEKAAEELDAKAKQAAEESEKAMANMIEVSNAWLLAEAAVATLRRFIENADVVAKGLHSDVEKKQAALAALESAVADFKTLEDPPVAAPVADAEMPAQEAEAQA